MVEKGRRRKVVCFGSFFPVIKGSRRKVVCLGSFFPVIKGYQSYCSVCTHKEPHKRVKGAIFKPSMFECAPCSCYGDRYYRCCCFPVKEAARIALLIKMGVYSFRRAWCDYD
jgi:hypothetical protein